MYICVGAHADASGHRGSTKIMASTVTMMCTQLTTDQDFMSFFLLNTNMHTFIHLEFWLEHKLDVLFSYLLDVHDKKNKKKHHIILRLI